MFSTSMRKCSAVVCRVAPTRSPAELLSSVLPSVILAMVILLIVLWSLLRFDPVDTPAELRPPPRSSRRPVPAAPTRAGYRVTAACPHELAFIGRLREDALQRAHQRLRPGGLLPLQRRLSQKISGGSWQTGKGTAGFARTRRRGIVSLTAGESMSSQIVFVCPPRQWRLARP